MATHLIGRARAHVGDLLERDDLIADGWLVFARTGSWTRTYGAMLDRIRTLRRLSARTRSIEVFEPRVVAVQDAIVLSDRRERAWALRTEGFLLRDIGAAVGVTPSCVSQWIKRLERDRGEKIEGVKRITPLRRVRAPVRERLVPILRKRQTTIAQICRDFGVSRTAAAAALTAAQGDRPWRRSDLRNGVRCARGHELAKTRRVSASGKLYCVGCRNHRRRWYRRRVAEREKREKGGVR